MCRIYARTGVDHYRCQTRSVRLGGHATSIRLEAMFWTILQEIAANEGSTVGRFLSKLHDEILADDRAPQNFASLLRCVCLTYLREPRAELAAAE
jgi:predicted DNA-binding ribbon-helix-helix protein